MKYTEAERMNIGRRIYEGEITQNEAAEEYCITPTTARNYMRLYRDTCQLPEKYSAEAATIITRRAARQVWINMKP